MKASTTSRASLFFVLIIVLIIGARALAASAAAKLAKNLISSIGSSEYQFTNGCDKPIDLAILYLDNDGLWQTVGWWNFSPGKSGWLYTKYGTLLTSKNRVWYSLAKYSDSSRQVVTLQDLEKESVWGNLSGKNLTMQEKRRSGDGDNIWRLSCDSPDPVQGGLRKFTEPPKRSAESRILGASLTL